MTEPPPVPADVPGERPAWLADLEVLVGSWELQASFEAGALGPDSPAATMAGGKTTFEWLDGRFFLVQRFTSGTPAAPSGIAVIGAEGQAGRCRQHYYDSRGVARTYEMSLDGGVWKLWRDEPGFFQRYEGRVSDDGRTIEGAWEKSADGADWQHDFGLTYVRSGRSARG